MLPSFTEGDYLSVSCGCKNINVSGLRYIRYPISGLETDIMKRIRENPLPLLQIRCLSISLCKYSNASCIKHNENNCVVKCLKCGFLLNIYYVRGNCYSQFSQISKRLARMSLPISPYFADLLTNVPRQMKCLFTPEERECIEINSPIACPILKEPISEPIEETDDDFSLMFSNTNERFVGSYTDSPILSFDSNLF